MQKVGGPRKLSFFSFIMNVLSLLDTHPSFVSIVVVLGRGAVATRENWADAYREKSPDGYPISAAMEILGAAL